MSKHRILIVDDDADARHMLTLALRSHFETVEASDGLDALSRLDILEPDLAIIDIMMATMDGYQLCQAIRKHPKYSNIPVMFLSAYGSKDNAKKSYAVGGNLFMTKPVDPDRVLKNIQFTIEHENPPIRHKRHSMLRLDAMGPEDFEALTRPRAVPEPEPEPAPPRVPPRARAEPPPAPPPRPAAESAPAAAPAGQVDGHGDGHGHAASHPHPSRAPKPATASSRPRILVVDDDAEARLMVDLSLRDDYEVTKASNGIEAIERMVEFEPDIMLIDIMMPKMNGYQLLQSIRRNPMFATLPVVVLSAKSARRDQEYATKLGATAYLAKPYQLDALQCELRRIVSAPGFRLRPKTRTIGQIHAEHFNEDKLDMDTLQRQTSKERLEALRDSFQKSDEDPFGKGRLD
jgi:CheY-like chemotaxis protein